MPPVLRSASFTPRCRRIGVFWCLSGLRVSCVHRSHASCWWPVWLWHLLSWELCMRAYATSSRSTRQLSLCYRIRRSVWELRSSYRARWYRFLSRFSGLYYRRVIRPVESWRAFGCPAEFRPRLPWWSGAFYMFLCLSGIARWSGIGRPRCARPRHMSSSEAESHFR